MTAPRWDRPGPGAWVYDAAHSTAPATPTLQFVFPRAMAHGFRRFTARYGLPISHIDVRYVHGFAFGAVRLAAVPPSDRPPPPAPILWALTRLHPELRRRNRAALGALEQRIWRHDLDRWFGELRPARLRSVRGLQAQVPDDLDDEALAGHVQACVVELAEGLEEHFSLVGAAALPVGLLLASEQAAGRPASEVFADLAGAASGSTGATVPALAAVAREVAAAGVVPASLDDVRRASSGAAVALDAYLAEHGERVIGALDVTGRRLLERPEVVVRSIDAVASLPAAEPPTDSPSGPVWDDARLALRSRDDHAGISCMWPLGLVRRALLAAGQRLAGGGAIDDPAHVFEASPPEVVALLRGGGAPDAATLAARAAERAACAALVPPSALGEAHPPPDPALLPSGLRRVSTALAAFLAAQDRYGAGRGAAAGVGIGTRSHRGRAVVASDPEDAIGRLEPGDVLITATTTPAFNCVLPIAGALVTEHGGHMSHAGIVARELGIPAVLGLPGACASIPDGAEVDVDPGSGTVRVIATG